MTLAVFLSIPLTRRSRRAGTFVSITCFGLDAIDFLVACGLAGGLRSFRLFLRRTDMPITKVLIVLVQIHSITILLSLMSAR